MLLRQDTLAAIAEGRVTLAFRRWKRPTVKAGGTLLTPIGQLAIDSVDAVVASTISAQEAEAAGFASVRELLTGLGGDEGDARSAVYRVSLRLAGPDPRIELRDEVPDAEALTSIMKRLSRWDAASPVGPWTRAALEVISKRPAVRAGDLAEDVGMDKARFKTNVRKLKGLGLTESLEIGYRLSPRGRVVLERVQAD